METGSEKQMVREDGQWVSWGIKAQGQSVSDTGDMGSTDTGGGRSGELSLDR